MQRALLKISIVALVAVSFASTASAQLVGISRGGGSARPAPELVPEGLGDGALCFVDRPHIYAGVPAQLAGADYVKVSNDDKTTADYSLELTLDADSVVYLLIDRRVGDNSNTTPPDLTAAMTWVSAMGFVPTGLTVGIDEGADDDVDQFGDVYAGIVSAGTTTVLEQNDGGSRNMYGVAVRPLAASPLPAHSDLGIAVLIALLLGGGAFAIRKVAVAC